MKPTFEPGENIAIKVPSHQYEQTVAFYSDILGLERISRNPVDGYDSQLFRFGDKRLWIDKIPHISNAEIWLEIKTDDVERAARYFSKHNVSRRDEIETLPSGFRGFWISGPSNIIHLVSERKT